MPMTIHLQKFVDRVRGQEARGARDLIMTGTACAKLTPVGHWYQKPLESGTESDSPVNHETEIEKENSFQKCRFIDDASGTNGRPQSLSLRLFASEAIDRESSNYDGSLTLTPWKV